MTKKPKPSGASNWGIPDWLDSSSYGDTKQWSAHRWRWEFMRRHEDCRADAHKDGTDWFDQEGGSGFSFDGDRRLRPDEPGFVAAVPNCYKKYGLRGLPNPAIGDQPIHIIWFLERRPEMVPYPWDGIDGSLFDDTDVVIKFDITAPIGDQLERARQFLEAEQDLRVGHLVESGKKHPAKWLTYLRTLDAKENGASYAEIAQSGVLNGRREDAQAARTVLQQAQALQFKWPT
jgi:hypothetical protein